MDTGRSSNSDAGWESIHPGLHLGTSSFSHESWVGSFYPEGTKPIDFLGLYARRFDTVEIDATFYRIPSASQARSWAARVPAGFSIATKMPQVVTHEKVLVDAGDEIRRFLGVLDELGDRSGPILFQFPYFNRKAFASVDPFLSRLEKILDSLPSGRRFAVEVRNKNWIGEPLLALLRARRVAFTLIDYPWITPIDELLTRHDVVTADFVYARWLGDRKAIEAKTGRWDKLIVDRTAEMERWAPALATLLERDVEVFGYFNNHYGGHAPGSIELLRDVWRRRLGQSGRTRGESK